MNVFCKRDEEGNLVYVESIRLEYDTNLMEETIALRMQLQYCISHYLWLVVLVITNVNKGFTWNMGSPLVEVKMIQRLKVNMKVEVEHTFRERNTLTDLLLIKFSFLQVHEVFHIHLFKRCPHKEKQLLILKKLILLISYSKSAKTKSFQFTNKLTRTGNPHTMNFQSNIQTVRKIVSKHQWRQSNFQIAHVAQI